MLQLAVLLTSALPPAAGRLPSHSRSSGSLEPNRTPFSQLDRSAKRAQHGTAPGIFVSAASLGVDAASSQPGIRHHESEHPSGRPGWKKRVRPSLSEADDQNEGSEVIDLAGNSPGE